VNATTSSIEGYLNRLDALDQVAAATGPEAARMRPLRMRFRRPHVELTASHRATGVGQTRVCTRNLADDSVGCISNVFIATGSPCTIRLRFDHQTLDVRGIVTRCRSLGEATYEVEVLFDQPISVAQMTSQISPESRAWASALHGTVAYIDDMPMDLLLAQHHLRNTQTQLTLVKTWRELQDELSRQSFDVVMVDLNLAGGIDGIDVIRQLRQGQFDGPIVVVSGETNADRLAAASAAGATHRIAKPYEAHELFTILGNALAEAGRLTQTDALYSTDAGRPDMVESIERFVQHLSVCAKRLEAALSANEAASARRVCLELKGSAAGFGFGAVGVLADAIFETMEVESELVVLSSRIKELVRMCRSTRSRKPASISPQTSVIQTAVVQPARIAKAA
jgi:CheY-like chemotaxis protein